MILVFFCLKVVGDFMEFLDLDLMLGLNLWLNCVVLIALKLRANLGKECHSCTFFYPYHFYNFFGAISLKNCLLAWQASS